MNSEPRLAMSLLVRDEVGLVETNLAVHSRLGVDCFVVTDNGSTDGTRETLERLRSDYEIVLIDEPEHSMKQDLWVNRMASVARTELGADWILNGDADEFWLPASGSLKSVLPSCPAAIECPRSNMLARRADVERSDYRFWDNTLRVVRPFEDATAFRTPPWTLREQPFSLARIGRKVLCSLEGLRSIGYGNHAADHAGERRIADDLLIYHYPIRTYPEFVSKVRHHGTSLENNPRIPDSIGWHVRRWYGLYRQGLLRAEYEMLTLDEAHEERCRAEGIIETDETCRAACREASAARKGKAFGIDSLQGFPR